MATRLNTKVNRNIALFVCVWVLTFVLYLPAAQAGFVSDFIGWLNELKRNSFGSYINGRDFNVKSLYQVTQIITYVFFRLFGLHAWLWHLLFITLHSLNACILYVFFKTLFTDAGIQRAKEIAAAGVLLFCVSPYFSEVIVWEPSFHFLTGLMSILVILRLTQLYLQKSNPKYIWFALLVFILSTHAIELFYTTPWLVLALILFYRVGLQWDKVVCRRAVLYFFLPLLALFVGHLVEYRLIYGTWVAHIGYSVLTGIDVRILLSKPFKYLFHILFLGRFFTHKALVYNFLSSYTGIAICYVLVCTGIYAMIQAGKIDIKAKLCLLLLVWTGIALAIMVPLWFPEDFLIIYDRYTYMPCAFIYMLVPLLLSYISIRKVAMGIYLLIVLANLRFAIQVNRYWMKSAKVVNNLLDTYTPANNKIVLLLDLPEGLHGASMISARSDSSRFKLMMHLLRPGEPVTGEMYDVASFNTESPTDGVHVTIINDSTVRVTQNQFGTWWWYDGYGAINYENAAYRFNNIDGHKYNLVLKRPYKQYELKFNTGGVWKTADWSKKNMDQY